MSSTEKTTLLQGIGFLLISGAALVLAYPPFDQGWVIWVALIPMLAALRVSPVLSRHPFAAGYLVGLLYFGGVFWWIGHVTVPGIIALVMYIALYPAIWLWAMQRWFAPKFSTGVADNLRFAVAGASLWVALEWMRGWFLTGFGWNNLGVALHANVPLIQLASVGGVYLISWLIVLVNVAAFRTFSRVYVEVSAGRPRGPLYELSFALLLVAIAFAWGWRETMRRPTGSARTLNYACVQANIPQTGSSSGYKEGVSEEENLRRHRELTEIALASKPELLLWPEATTNLAVLRDEPLASMAVKFAREGKCYFLLGSSDDAPGKLFNAAFLLHPTGVDYQVYHKNKLVIFGEYVPLVKWFPFLKNLVPFGTGFTAGDKPGYFKLPTLSVSLAPLICFEDTLPGQVRAAVDQQPDILVNVTNDSWFQESPGAEQHLVNALFRTVETDRPLLRCANTGITAEISQRGVVRARLTDSGLPSGATTGRSLGAYGVLSRELRWYSPRLTLYQRWGDWVPLVSALVCLGLSLPRKKKELPDL